MTLPFGDFLEALRDKGFAIGLHEYVAVGKLLDRWDSTDRAEIRDSLAALIARNEDEVREISDAFDAFYPVAASVEVRATGERTRERTFTFVRIVRRSAPWAALLVAVMAVWAAVLADRWAKNQPIPQVVIDPPVPSTGPAPTTPSATSPAPVPDFQYPDELPAPPSNPDWRSVSWLATATAMLMMVGLWGSRMREGARQWTAEAWRNELAHLPGPFHGALVLKDLISRMPRADVEDAATVLSRAFSSDWRGNELDVPRSLRRTLRSGMQPHLIFKPRRVQESILVLQDVSQSMAVHARKVDSLNTDLRRQGVVLEHWYFDGDVALPSRHRFGAPVPLADLFRSRGDGPVLILSAGAGVPATLARTETDWLLALRRRTRLAWVNPITDPKLWPAAMPRLPVLIVPMTRAGLLHAAHALAHDDYIASRPLRRITAPAVTTDHVQQLRRLASVVPYPTPEFLELLRQRFAPAIPESAVLYAVDAKAASTNLPFKMSDDEIREHLRELRVASPALERQVREYLVKVLNDSEPQRGSAAHLRWQASRAIHQVQIAELSGADAGAAAETLRQLYNSPLWEEVKELIGRQSSTGETMKQLRAAVGAKQRRPEPPAFTSRADHAPANGFRWVGPGWRAPVAATAVALVVAAAGAFTSPFRVQASHRLGAYTIEYVPPPSGVAQGRLAIRATDPASNPQAVQLYRDGAVWGTPVTISGAAAQTVGIEEDQAHVYQARATLPSGALAVSNSIFAPSVLVVIDAQPWARVSVFATTPASERPLLELATPATTFLPLGNYELRLENGGVTEPSVERIAVTRDGPRAFQFTMPGFDAQGLVKQLSGSARGARAR